MAETETKCCLVSIATRLTETLYEAGHEDDVDDEELYAVGTTHLIDHRHEWTEPRRSSATSCTSSNHLLYFIVMLTFASHVQKSLANAR